MFNQRSIKFATLKEIGGFLFLPNSARVGEDVMARKSKLQFFAFLLSVAATALAVSSLLCPACLCPAHLFCPVGLRRGGGFRPASFQRSFSAFVCPAIFCGVPGPFVQSGSAFCCEPPQGRLPAVFPGPLRRRLRQGQLLRRYRTARERFPFPAYRPARPAGRTRWCLRIPPPWTGLSRKRR